MNTTMLESIINSESLPSMPLVAFKVLELCRERDVRIQDVADVICNDPALTAKMLKVANSSLFGMSKKVASIQQAMVVLGLRTAKIMSLGFSLVDAMKDKSNSGFDYARYWRRSLSAAVAARQLAVVASDVRRDEAFVGGLLCDIGMVAAERHPDGIYRPVVEAHEEHGGRIQDLEQAIVGVTHAQISAMMLDKWSMPEVLCHAVAAHHGDGFETLDPRSRSLAAVLWAASEIAELFTGDTGSDEFAGVWGNVTALVGIQNDALDGVFEAINDNVRETAELFSVDAGEEVSYEDMRQGAMIQLAQLSMSAEHDRAMAESREHEARSKLQTLSQLNESLQAKANTDKLTGIANRQAFDEQLAQTLEKAESSRSDVGLIIIDLDHFKRLNDTYGHLVGDEMLKAVGKTLKKVSEGPRFAARYGGEEFAFIVTETNARELREFAEDIRKNIARIRFTHGGRELTVTASLGAAHVSFAEEVVTGEELIQRADECLYDAKSDGRNRVEITF